MLDTKEENKDSHPLNFKRPWSNKFVNINTSQESENQRSSALLFQWFFLGCIIVAKYHISVLS